MQTYEAIQQRRSIKVFQPREIETEKVGLVLDAARHAPSSGNIQNWFFTLINDPAMKQKLSQCCFDQAWIANAPLLIVITADLNRAKTLFGQKGASLYTVQNCACAAQNLMLMATELGLGTCMVSAMDEEEISTALAIPGHVKLQTIIAIGYPAETPDMPSRYQLETITHFSRWGRKIRDMDDALGEIGGPIREVVERTFGAVEQVNEKVEKESKGIFKQIKKRLGWK